MTIDTNAENPRTTAMHKPGRSTLCVTSIACVNGTPLPSGRVLLPLFFNFRRAGRVTNGLQLGWQRELVEFWKIPPMDAVSLLGWQLEELRFWKMTLMVRMPMKPSFSPWMARLTRLI